MRGRRGVYVPVEKDVRPVSIGCDGGKDEKRREEKDPSHTNRTHTQRETNGVVTDRETISSIGRIEQPRGSLPSFFED